MIPGAERLEWLETDGRGGFASGTVSGVRTRRYHALLLHATRPPLGRYVLVNGAEVHVEVGGTSYALSAQRYAPDVTWPDGEQRLQSFTNEPWPTWTYVLPDGATITQELFVCRDAPVTVMAWRAEDIGAAARLIVRPLLSGRDIHATQHENGAFRFDAEVVGAALRWQAYPDVPAVLVRSNGEYRSAPEWYRNFQYDVERERGLDFMEDLASPGEFSYEIGRVPAVWISAADDPAAHALFGGGDAEATYARLRDRELLRRTRMTARQRAAEQYVVQRANGLSIIAGYPWFTDWGRDTFISVRGLCLANGRVDQAENVLMQWTGLVSEGMLPNYLPEAAQEPEYNSVDASLWFIIAYHDLLQQAARDGYEISAGNRAAMAAAVTAILEGYARGTRFGIGMTNDGLLQAGVEGVQLTWMDAKVGNEVMTPRIGKPVEVNALWCNALAIGGHIDAKWQAAALRAMESFNERFWNEARGCLYDVVDCDSVAGKVDDTVRPNQLLAIGGLPFPCIDPAGERARSLVGVAERELWTEIGPRSLAPADRQYAGRYQGGPGERDRIYHQGNVWPWLAGPFIEAWLRVRGSTQEAAAEAEQKFIAPLRQWLNAAGIGHLPEIADGDAPHDARGCPFQAWSLGELCRIEAMKH